jgi:hypothetical protein
MRMVIPFEDEGLIAARPRRGNRLAPPVSAVAGDQPERRPRRLGQAVHLFKVEFGQLKVGHRRFLARRRLRAVEFLERTVGVVADGFFA